MQPIMNYINHPAYFADALVRRFGQWLPDSVYISLRYRFQMGRKLNIKNPKTFSEKLQWLKLYDQDPEYTKMVDKVLVKDYVKSVIGSQYVIPLLGVWDKPEEIDWDILPNQFVLKTNHSGGNTGVVICKNKSSFDRDAAIKKMNLSLRSDVYRDLREWPYKNIERKVFAEMYIEPRIDTRDLPDYKFFCFDGEVKGLFVATERQNPNEDVKFDFFDTDYNHLPFQQEHDKAKVTPPKPQNFDLMKRIASQLSKGMSHVRVDLYDLGDRVFFGEMMFYHFAGMAPLEPEKWDKIFRDMLTLPGEKCGGVIIRGTETNEIKIESLDLPDYKFFCFNGVPKFCQVISGRGSRMSIDFFDRNWNHQPFHEPKNFPFAEVQPAKPKNLDIMWEAASKLSKEKAFSRIDFYDLNDKVYFGEITFYPTSGMGGFDPSCYDEVIGKMIELPGINGGGGANQIKKL